VVPSLNVTVPVADEEDTVAVKVTDCPEFEGFSEEPNVVVVLALFIVSVPVLVG
jgi:hypothetical protein